MVCSDCKNCNVCSYDKLQDFEEGCIYPPCVYMSDEHINIIDEHINEAMQSFEF